MKSPNIRRRALTAIVFIPLMGSALSSAWSQSADNYPNKVIRILVGTPPGSGTDTNARFLAQRLSMALKQPVVVENKAGAHGQIALSGVKSAVADGYTLLFAAGGTMAINKALHGDKFPYDTLRDFEPVVGLERAALYLAVNKSLPVYNIKDMVTYVKSRGGQPVHYGTGGNGTTSHMAMEMLGRRAGIETTHVPYRGSAMVLQDLIGGQLQFAFDAAAVMIPQASIGSVRIIAIASPTRSKVLPNVPTVAEQGFPDFEASTWSGLYAPKGTPPAIMDVLNKAVNAEMKSAEFVKKQEGIGSTPVGGTSADFRKLIEQQTQHWIEIVKETGVKPD